MALISSATCSTYVVHPSAHTYDSMPQGSDAEQDKQEGAYYPVYLQNMCLDVVFCGFKLSIAAVCIYVQ